MRNIYTNQPKKSMSPWIMLPVFIIAIIVGFTLAYFFTSDYASKYLDMSGKVKIEAVGKGTEYFSIEDTSTSSNLVIELEDNYDVLIPGMLIDMQANCRVYKSTTKPLLRAKFDLEFKDVPGSDLVEDEQMIVSNMYAQLYDIVVDNDDWYLHTDGYFYYLGELEQPKSPSGGGTSLRR